MQTETETGATNDRVETIARRHGFSVAAAQVALKALARGSGRMAQFNHPELGGLGQWSSGMVMIGEMSNPSLKGRVASLFADLANLDTGASATEGGARPSPSGAASEGPMQSGSAWWPAHLGTPSTSGGQNEVRYAFFPDARRLVIDKGGHTQIYDTGDHRIAGVQQQQGGSPASLEFTSQFGRVRLEELQPVER